MARRTGYCTCCDKWRTQYGHHNLCSACYTRWLDHGKPNVCPPPTRPARTFTTEDRRRSAQVKRANRDGRIEDYQWLRTEQHHTQTEAAQRLHISITTARSYDQLIRQETAA